jgi:polyisoprenoid-binding protein YceI
MRFSRIVHHSTLGLLAVILLAACAPVASSNPIPTTGLTVTDTASPSATSGASANPTLPAATAASSAGTGASGSGIKYVLVASKSEASYSVREQLARLNLPSDAIGTTSNISGSITVNSDGSIDANNSKFTVDVSSLQTDQAMRDNFVRRNILQTSQYPNAVFVPTKVSGLPAAIPQSGSVTFQVTGNLTIRDVTKPVTWDVTGAITNGEATGTATTSFTFEDFNLSQPTVAVVLSVVDKITLTVKVDLQVSGN